MVLTKLMQRERERERERETDRQTDRQRTDRKNTEINGIECKCTC